MLHMRYTARAISIEWKSDAATKAALAALEDILGAASPCVFRGRLEPAWAPQQQRAAHAHALHRFAPASAPDLPRATTSASAPADMVRPGIPARGRR